MWIFINISDFYREITQTIKLSNIELLEVGGSFLLPAIALLEITTEVTKTKVANFLLRITKFSII